MINPNRLKKLLLTGSIFLASTTISESQVRLYFSPKLEDIRPFETRELYEKLLQQPTRAYVARGDRWVYRATAIKNSNHQAIQLELFVKREDPRETEEMFAVDRRRFTLIDGTYLPKDYADGIPDKGFINLYTRDKKEENGLTYSQKEVPLQNPEKMTKEFKTGIETILKDMKNRQL